MTVAGLVGSADIAATAKPAREINIPFGTLFALVLGTEIALGAILAGVLVWFPGTCSEFDAECNAFDATLVSGRGFLVLVPMVVICTGLLLLVAAAAITRPRRE